jgi:hypothetical protein
MAAAPGERMQPPPTVKYEAVDATRQTGKHLSRTRTVALMIRMRARDTILCRGGLCIMQGDKYE